MYEDAMSGIYNHLVQKSLQKKMTYTAELIPQRDETGQMFVLALLFILQLSDLFPQRLAISAQTRPPRVLPRWFVDAGRHNHWGQ
jgi:hypothetical protein